MLTRCPAYWCKTPARHSCAPRRAARGIARDGSVFTRFVRPAAWKDQPNQLQNVASLCNFIISFFCFLKNQFFCSKTSDLLLCDQKNLVLWLAGMSMGELEYSIRVLEYFNSVMSSVSAYDTIN